MYFIIVPCSIQSIPKLFINQAPKCKYQLSHLKVKLTPKLYFKNTT